MPDVLNQSGRFEPIHAAHAIEQVVFVLRVERPLDEASFSNAREAVKQFKVESDMPGQAEIQAFGLAIGPFGQAPLPQSPIAGFALHRMCADGSIEKELRIERDSVTFRTSLYTRWDTVWLQARNYFEALVPIYAANARIVGISLNYVDKFKWAGDLTGCNTGILLQSDSKYLCPYVFEAKDFWHSHTGAFIRVNESTKRLLNVNVDYLDENRPDDLRRVVSITTVLTDLMNQPGYEPSEIAAGDAIQFLDSHMQGLHVFGKEILGNIINNEMSKRIALIG